MTTRHQVRLTALSAFVTIVLATSGQTRTHKGPIDPGVRGGAAGAGSPIKNLTADESTFFQDGFTRFIEVEVVQGGSNNGLGPRFNSNQCLSCHSQPAAGGTSPAQNPLIAVATLNGVATSRNRISRLPEIRSPARAEIQISSFASPRRSLGLDSLKQFPIRRFSPICTPTPPRRPSWVFTVTPTHT